MIERCRRMLIERVWGDRVDAAEGEAHEAVAAVGDEG